MSSTAITEVDLLKPLPVRASNFQRTIWVAVIAGFVLRFAWVLLGNKFRFTSPDRFDFGQEIGSIAHSIVSGRGFSSPFPESSGPTTWIAPVYPALVALVFKVFGLFSTASAIVLFGLNCAFSAATCWPIVGIAREVTSRRVAIVSAWLWALLPPFMIWAVDWVWDASLTTLVLICLVWLSLRLAQSVTARGWIGFGLLWGFAALLNPSLLSLVPATIAYIAWKARSRGERWLAPAAMCCVVVILTIAPWLVRNYVVFGRFVFIRGNFWAEMHYGNSTYADGTWMGFTHPEINHYERAKYLRLGEQAYFDSKKKEVQQFISENPNFFAQLCSRRVLFYWWDFNDVSPETPEVLKAMARRTFSTLALVGVVFLWVRRRPSAALLTGILVLFPLPYYLTYPYGRYRHVIEPLLLICAIYALAQVREFKNLLAADEHG